MTKQSAGRTWGYVRGGWLLWMGELNSPWLPMSVRASKNWYYWQQNPFLLLHLGKAWNVRINSISSHSAWARAGPLARGLAAVDGRAELIAHDCQCQSELFLSEIRKKCMAEIAFFDYFNIDLRTTEPRQLKPCCCFLDISLAYYIYPT